MSIVWVIIGSFLQLCLALFLFMLVVFSGGGIANGSSLGPVQLKIINLSMYLLPSICLLSAGIVIYQYLKGGSAYSYSWYALPVLATFFYFFYVNNLQN